MTPDKPRGSTVPAPSRKVKAIAFVLTCLVVLVCLVVALEPFVTLHWALTHPNAYRRHDPHHWLLRLALLSIVLAFGQVLWQSIRQWWQSFRAWQRAFLPMPWQRKNQQTEPEQAAA